MERDCGFGEESPKSGNSKLIHKSWQLSRIHWMRERYGTR
jgi:hypothetical protein